MSGNTIINIAIIASPIIALLSFIWTVLWSRRVMAEARKSQLADEVGRIGKLAERAHERIDVMDSKVDALPTAAAISKIDGDIREMRSDLLGVRDLMGGLEKWMARMDEYLHKK